MKLLEEMQMVEEMEKSLSAGNRDKRTSNKSGNRLKKSIIRGGKKLQDKMRAKENAEIKSKVFAALKNSHVGVGPEGKISGSFVGNHQDDTEYKITIYEDDFHVNIKLIPHGKIVLHKKYIIPAFEKQGFINVMVGPQFSYEIDAEY